MTGETIEKFYMRKLPELRRKRGAARKEVAKGVGVTLGKYDKWESGKVIPKAMEVDRLAEFYGISIDEMLEITPEESAAINRQIIADAEQLPPEQRKNVLRVMRDGHPELFPDVF
jgi:transcriptional regulator with XRE-family HTH domain